MSPRVFLQDHPTAWVWAWRLSAWALRRLGGLFERLGVERVSRLLHPLERAFKRAAFDCRSCGQCILHYTGMTCPMTCPKQLRNGPCGGVRADGSCEVYPERDCVWVKALERIERTPYAGEVARLNPPVDWQLEGEASWVTYATGRDQVPTGTDEAPRYTEVSR